MVGTVDFLYSKAINSIYMLDQNLVQGADNIEGRAMYGTINPATGRSTADKVTSNFRQVIFHTNKSKDYSTALSFQLQKQFTGNIWFSAGYTWSRTKDLMSLTSSIASSNLGFAPLQGTQADRELGISAFDQPHKITISGTVNAPFKTQLSLTYIGISGRPYTYMVNGDANADGITSNDIAFIPGDASEIEFSGTPEQQADKFNTLQNYMNVETCLQDNEGRIMERNTCRNPWQNRLNARVGKTIPLPSGQSLEITADLFNVLRMIGSDWGLIRQTAAFETVNLFRLAGFDTATGRPIYDLSIPQRNQVQTEASRWQIQLGAKYTF
jgi:hypothetical protein